MKQTAFIQTGFLMFLTIYYKHFKLHDPLEFYLPYKFLEQYKMTIVQNRKENIVA